MANKKRYRTGPAHTHYYRVTRGPERAGSYGPKNKTKRRSGPKRAGSSGPKSKAKRTGGTAATRGGTPRVGPFKAKKSGFTQTAGQWTDTKPVSLRKQYQKAPYYEGGTVAARPRRAAKKPNEHLNRKPKVSKGASAGRIEHLHRKPKYGQPQYPSNINAGAAKRTKELSRFLGNAAREAQRRQWN